MSDDLTELRHEVAQLRAELKEVRTDLRKALHLLGVTPLREGEAWPQYLSLEVESLILRNPEKPAAIPIRIENTEHGARIRFDDEGYQTRAELTLDAEGVSLAIRNAEGQAIVSLGEIKAGTPHVYVAKPDGKPAAGMQVKNGHGMVSVMDGKNYALALLTETEAGGELIVANRNARSAVTAKASGIGGMVTVHEPSGQLMGFLSAGSDFGAVSVYGPLGNLVGTMGGSPEGGVVHLSDNDGKARATYPEEPVEPEE